MSLGKLIQYHQGNQDFVWNPLFFISIGVNKFLKDKLGPEHSTTLDHTRFLETIDRARWMLRWGVSLQALHTIRQNKGDFLTKVSACIDLVYHVFDIGFFLQMIMPKTMKGYSGPLFARISCMCWFINNWLGIYKLVNRLQEITLNRTDDRTKGSPEDKKILKEVQTIKQNIGCLMVDSILASNWASKKEFLHPYQLSVLGTCTGLINLKNHYHALEHHGY